MSPSTKGHPSEHDLSSSNSIQEADAAGPKSPPDVGSQPNNNRWTDYLRVASQVDESMIKDWSTMVDVVLIYVTIFIGALFGPLLQVPSLFQRDTGAVSNDLLIALYKRAVDPSFPPINTDDLLKLDPANHKKAVLQSTLLYMSFGISLIVYTIATGCKLWLVRYGRAVNAPGSPFERAMARQKAFSGARAWKLSAFVEVLPLLVLIGVFLIALLAYLIILDLNNALSLVYGGLAFIAWGTLIIPSIYAAFVPAAPFQSVFSDLIKFVFTLIPNSFRTPPLFGQPREFPARAITAIITSLAWFAAVSYLVPHTSLAFSALLYIPVPSLCSLARGWKEEENMRARMFNPPILMLIGTSLVLGAYGLATLFADINRPLFYVFLGIGITFKYLQGYFWLKMSERLPKTTEAEAVAWVIALSPPKDAAKWYQHAVDLANASSSLHPFLFNKLLPVLKRFITSPYGDDGSPAKPQDQEEHIKCLAKLANFEDSKGSFLNNTAPIEHGCLPIKDPLRDELRKLKNAKCPSNLPQSDESVGPVCPSGCVRCSAVLILQKFGEEHTGSPKEKGGAAASEVTRLV